MRESGQPRPLPHRKHNTQLANKAILLHGNECYLLLKVGFSFNVHCTVGKIKRALRRDEVLWNYQM